MQVLYNLLLLSYHLSIKQKFSVWILNNDTEQKNKSFFLKEFQIILNYYLELLHIILIFIMMFSQLFWFSASNVSVYI